MPKCWRKLHFFNMDLTEDPYVGISQNIRSSSSHMYCYVVVFKNLAKFTGMLLHQRLFSTCNLQLHWKRDLGTYSVLWVLRNFLRTLLIWKTSCKLNLIEEFYKKRQTDILIKIKIYRKVDSFFKNTDIAKESVYLRI